MDGFISFLNENAGVFAAVAAMLTAIATAVIAVFSWGAWREHKREEDRSRALDVLVRHGVTSVGITSIFAAFLADWLAETGPEAAVIREPILDIFSDLTEQMANDYFELFDSVAHRVSDPTVMDDLSTIRTYADHVRSRARRVRLEDRDDFRWLGETFREMQRRCLVYAPARPKQILTTLAEQLQGVLTRA